jgi:U6 snRNA-associated Sm-like protein LSm1
MFFFREVSAELVPVRRVLFILNYRNSFLGNLVLHQAFERICVGRQYADIPRGLFVIRGENVLLIGELDFHQPIRVPLVEVTIEEILKLQKEDIEKKERIEKLRQKAMVEHGLVDDGNPIEEHY